MKKIYTLFAAAAVAMTATAAVPVSAELPSLKSRELTPATVPAGRIQYNPSNSEMHKAPAKASSVASVEDLEALYLQDVYSMTEEGWYSAALNQFVVEADGSITLDGFAYSDVKLTDGVWDAETGTITFQQQSYSFDYSGTEVIFYFSTFRWSWDDENYVPTDEPMVFTAYPEDREIYYQGEFDAEGYIDSFIGVVYEMEGQQQAWDYYFAVDLNEVNSIMECSYLANETDTELTDLTAYIYTSIDGENLYCDDLFGQGFGFPVAFAVDANTSTATVTDGLVSAKKDSQGNTLEFYLCDVAETADGAGLDDTVVNFQIGMQDGVTLLYAPYTACVATFGGSTYTLIPNVVVYGLTVVYQGDLIADMAGVEDITIDVDNSNAPVEYFNLQGQRVANPAAGQVYIRRQGTTAAKVRF